MAPFTFSNFITFASVKLLQEHRPDNAEEEDEDGFEPEEEEEEEEGKDVEDVGEPPVKRPIIEEADDKNKEGLWKRFLSWIVKEIPFLKTRKGRAGIIFNFLRGLELNIPQGLCQLQSNTFVCLFGYFVYCKLLV